MNAVGSIALSGLNAAMLRLGAAADNIANVRSNGPLAGAAKAGAYPAAYTPVRAVQTAVAGGGTQARILPLSATPIPMYDPSAPYADDQGYVAAPNIDLAGEMLELMSARHAFAANLRVIETWSEMTDSLFKTTA